MTHRVVVTGIGTVSPCGLDAESTWNVAIAGASGIGPITRFDASEYTTRIAGEVTGFNPENWVEKKRLREGDRFSHFAIAASEMAINDAGLDPDEEHKKRVGTFIGVGFCGLDILEETARTLFERGPRRVSPYFIPAVIPNLAPGQVSMRWGYKGPSFTTCSACASGSHAIGEAFRWIQRGGVDVAIAGGTEAPVTPLGVAGFTAMRALSKHNEQPEKASRPFDKGRDGFVIAEGAGILVLEEREHAIKRGAKIYAEIIGYGATADAYHLTQPSADGDGGVRAMRLAVEDARLSLADIDYINAHGTATLAGDIIELRAVKALFGPYATEGLSISSTKSIHGHLLGASGGLEAILTILTICRGIMPPTINLDDPIEEAEGLDLVPNQAREKKVRVAMSNSFGFGGTNATLVFKKYE
ncbi:MAG: beta-ketoacyl-ACP synthase II [Deltaproteobacteria bacterium]|nr:beta-ketoacyl-ACP synthase II [Deltaproteobacteria bacterium]